MQLPSDSFGKTRGKKLCSLYKIQMPHKDVKKGWGGGGGVNFNLISSAINNHC
jgi:hypothetical protein